MPASQTPSSEFLAKLRAMDATGGSGFEGFVRDCLEETLGTRFRLMKSGHQDGADIRKDAPANHLQIAVEGKRYGNTTALPTEQLQLKIVSAARSGAPLDLWVLVTTRTISATDRIKLAQTGDIEGVATAVLDAADGEGRPSALTMLAANAPDAFARHFPTATRIAAWLETVRKADGYAERLARVIEPFNRNDVGYAAARNASSQWLITALADEATARARLDSFAGLEADGAIVIPRRAVETQLDAWLETGPSAPLAILGDEGVGKTWSLLGWWRRRMRETSNRLPLTLVVAASTIAGVGNVGGPDLIARLLNERFPIRNEDFWRRRLALWAQEQSIVPQVLLVIDGLNQQPEFVKWQQVIQPLADSQWKGLFATAITCRKAWWNDELKGLPTILPAFHPIEVPIFDDTELNEILARFSLDRADFTEDMQRILAVPRYCQLAIRRRGELADSGDVTIERLIYEDWRHRIARVGAGLAPTEEEFRGFIAQQGARLRSALEDQQPTISRLEMVEALDRESGHGEPALRTALSEIIDGNWMQRAPGGGRRFTLNPLYVPFALALALHNELGAAGEAAAPDRLATFMDPLRGTDRGTAILRNAFTIALLDANSPDWVFKLLLDTWFNQQNFGPADATVLSQLAPAAPERFLSFAERLWSGDRRHLRDDSVLIGAIVRAAGSTSFRQILRQTLTNWLSRIDHKPDTSPWIDRADPEAHRARATEIDASAAAWFAVRDQLDGVDHSHDVAPAHYQGSGDQARLALFAAGVLSYLPRAEFLSCFVAWAVARTIARDDGDAATEWTLRVNAIDPVEGTATVLSAARAMVASAVPIAADAGKRLLEAVATPEAGEVAAGAGVERYSSHPARGVEIGADGALSLTTAGEQLGDFGRLKNDALLPDRSLAPRDLEQLRLAADRFGITDLLASGRSRSGSDISFEQAETVLARWAPEKLASIVRGAFRSAPDRMAQNDDPEADSAETLVSGLVGSLQYYWPMLGACEMTALQPVVEAFLPKAFEENHSGEWLRLQVPRLWGRTSAEQIDMLATDPHGPNFYESDAGVFSPLEASDFPRLAELIGGEWSVHWLGFLLFADHRAMPGDFQPLYAHLASDDLEARKRVQQIFRFGSSPERYRHLVESGWRWDETMDRDESATGSLNLFHARTVVPIPDLEDRVDPELWSAILAEEPENQAALERYVDYLVAEISRHRFPGGINSHHWLNQTDAVRIAASMSPGRLVSILDELIASDPHHAFGFDDFPVVDVLSALCISTPADGARIWGSLWDGYLGSSWTLPGFEQIPFIASDPLFLPLRESVLDMALSDAKIETLVAGAIEGGNEAWLLERISRMLSGPTAGEIAKALTMARFLEPSAPADRAWERIDVIPVSNWLSKIRERARREYDLGRMASFSAQRFLAGLDPDQLLADMILFRHAADTPAFIALKRAVDQRYDELSPIARAFWQEWDERLKTAAKKNSDGRDKRFVLEDPPKATHHPWRP